jgi:hypothetical protein
VRFWSRKSKKSGYDIEPSAPSPGVLARIRRAHRDELLRAGEWQRLQEQRIDDAEDRGVRADAERERHDGDDREAGILRSWRMP